MNESNSTETKTLTRSAYARAGLIGNPSDGYNGKTISVIVRNFSATVTLEASRQLEIVPGIDDGSTFDSIGQLSETITRQGYYGGTRLLKAAIKRFFEFAAPNHNLHRNNFSIFYTSDIPRQVGLAGSSAIVTAALRALMAWYEIEIPPHLLASLTLSAESELGIPAGLQDRVIQAYEGVVYMDFGTEQMQTEQGLSFGSYESMDSDLLPPLYVAFAESSGEPTEVLHNNLRQRFNDGEATVVDAMKRFADLAAQARDALLAGKPDLLHVLIDQNFDLRRSICRIQPEHERMVETARSVGASGKNCGSGGAIIGTYSDDLMLEKLTTAMANIGCTVIRPQINQ